MKEKTGSTDEGARKKEVDHRGREEMMRGKKRGRVKDNGGKKRGRGKGAHEERKEMESKGQDGKEEGLGEKGRKEREI
jgi:hypothetical protein